ncbi:GTP-binding protein [Anaeromicrobium sediminis]|uniref:Elongation factor G n=1 Tax=Anaeromicrobium sediminis TaxID=1478221 RepID=A0A267MKD0_9FIRM|nr:TetM/TetW/TetO/TetS family tetracycline resistance ribosomal protection protein [Anaeromicrobium sediminis]PAB60039.1 elongation factor G [Anaeromicrobium sediminis]
MNKTIGILAHVDAGKTTFSEGLLYHTNTIRQRGRVDHKDSHLDSHEIERERGITVFSDQAVMKYKDSTYYLIDTPGHVDFSPEMERSIKVMDYGIIIISAVEGVQGHTETVWQLLKKHNIPTFFFINKIDRVGANVDNVLNEIKLNLTEDLCDITDSFNDDMDEELIEFIAERDEELLEKYMEDGYNKDTWLKYMKKMIKENRIYPCVSGSALQDVGVIDFLDKFHTLTYTEYDNEETFSARVYKIGHENNGTKITYMKLLSGKLKVRDEITYSNGQSEKITQIRVYDGNKFKTINEAHPGELIGVIGLSQTWAGQGLGNLGEEATYNMIPTLKSKVIFDSSLNIKEVVRAFNILDSEDPSLKVTWEEELQEIHIHVMGPIQLEILEQIVKDRFGFSVEFGEPNILYKETINGEVIGYGHFEPLGHYSEVHLKIESGERNSGIKYENLCHADHLTIGNQNLVKHHVYEREHRGILTGSPITDIKVTLLRGRAHNKHTSGGDFRQATYRALRQGLEKAENILLEPYYDFKIKVDLDHMGRVLSDVQKASGTFNPPETVGDKTIVTGRVPVATFMNYPMELVVYTHGKGVISLAFSGYDICHNQDMVIEKIGYDKNIDMEYTSSSIFCSKGQAYVVPWDNAEEEMHCL